MTTTQRTAYAFLAEMVLLLMLYAAMTLLAAVRFITVGDPLTESLPYNQLGGFASVLLNLAVVTGLLGGGVFVVASQRPDKRLVNETALTVGFRLWSALLVAAFFAGLLGLLEGRNGLGLPLLLDAVEAALAALIVITVAVSVPRWTAIPLVWTVALALHIACTLGGLILTSDYLQDRALRALVLGTNINIAYILAAVALGYWLMHRFSNVMSEWVERSLPVTAGLLALAGALLTLSTFYTLGAAGSIFLPIAIPVLYLIFAAHSYRALSNRNPTLTLAAHWYALGLALLFLGAGLIGGLQSAPSVQQWTAGTRLTDLQTTLTILAVVAMLLGVANQAAAELRGQNWRVTGLMPFWLVAFGVIGGGLALGGAGLVQVYLERISSVGYLETQTMLAPLYALWVIGLLAMALGVGIYALGFWARRPVEKIEERT